MKRQLKPRRISDAGALHYCIVSDKPLIDTASLYLHDAQIWADP